MTEHFAEMWKEKKYRIIIPAIHFLLSFIYERALFIFELDRNVVTAMPLNYVISDKAERIFGYVTSKVFALLFIFAVWQIVWFVVDNRKRLFVWILVVAGLVVTGISLAVYPFISDCTWDSLVAYSYAIRFWPGYWHNAYTSLIFAGAMMVCPSPVAIVILQPVFSFAAIGYLYKRMEKSPVLNGRGKNLSWLLVLIPGFYSVCTAPDRIGFYAIFSMFFFSVIVMDALERRTGTTIDTVLVILMAAFFSVWRSEGIIFGIMAVFLVVVLCCKGTKVRKTGLVACYMLFVVLLMIPQKLGNEKYYGKDYQIYNSFASLSNILNSTEHNLSYEGAEDDLEAIEKIIPLGLVASEGLEGYRKFNYANGRADINQSMATKEDAGKYLKAYYRILLHNPKIYLKTQFNCMAATMGFVKEEYVIPYNGENPVIYPNWNYVGFDNGRADWYGRKLTNYWMYNIYRQNMLVKYMKVKEDVSGCFESIFYTPVFCGLFLLVMIFVTVRGIIRLFKKRFDGFEQTIYAVFILGEIAAIMLVMPWKHLGYIQPAMFLGMIMVIVYGSKNRGKRKKEKLTAEI